MSSFPRKSDIRELGPGRSNHLGRDELDGLLRKFYEVISFEEGGSPDWNAMSRLFSKNARVTRVTPEGVDYLDLAGFRDLAEELLEVGAFTTFFEREVARRVDRYGSVIHVASAYETKTSPAARDYIERGINSIQLILEDGTWRIVSLCWDAGADLDASGLDPIGHKELALGKEC